MLVVGLSALLLAVAAPYWLPLIRHVVPDGYIMAYAPSAIQRMVFEIDVSEQVPVPVSVAEDSSGADALLLEVAPTATPTLVPEVAPSNAQQQGGGYVQPTAVAIAPTPTVTPAYSPPVDSRAEDRENSADLGEVEHLLTGFEFEQQGLNNCGPASLRVMMSYWGVKFSEEEAASFLKPVADDPNVRPDEMAAFAAQLDYEITVRVDGDFDILKRFILAGYPVMIETGYDPEPETVGWTSHYLTLVGFSNEGFIAMDTYRRPNWFYPYSEIDYYWRQFNRRYLVAYRPDQASAVSSIIGEDMDDATMYQNGVFTAQAELSFNRDDPFGWFNLGSSLNGLGRYEEATQAFDEARRLGLPWRFLWYQFTPYEAYLNAGRFDEVIVLADAVLEKRAIEEAFYYKGLALAAMGEDSDARTQLGLALRYNRNYEAAQLALDAIGDG